MPGRKVSDAQRREASALIARGLTQAQVADRTGMSTSSVSRLIKGLRSGHETVQGLEWLEEEQPAPRALEQLDGGVRDTLRFDGGFSNFCSTFLLRRPTPWREDAARRVVAALEDRSRRSFVVANMPPGVGKSTLFTCDIPLWLIAGGGLEDPARGRAIRIMLGAFAMQSATRYVRRIRQLLESPRPFYDKETQREAELSLVKAFGRFKPRQQGAPWQAEQLIVEQLVGMDLTEKEPTVQAASRERGFLGERVEYACWDDLVTTANVRNVEVRESLAEWFGDEAETRVEPGGVALLIGQRLAPEDLYRNRLDVTFTDAEGQPRRKYEHIAYPAHNEESCDGAHRQWNASDEGCLLDEHRLPWSELEAEQQSNPIRFSQVYQQQDADPTAAMVDDAWITGGVDRDGIVAPGAWDHDRGWLEWPKGVSGLVDYVSIDPSAGHWWAIEWWSYLPEEPFTRYLIQGVRSTTFQAGNLLQYGDDRKLEGLMEDWQLESRKLGHPIRAWVIESNSGFKLLTQFDHFRAWQKKWSGVSRVILHKTQLNKIDEQVGVQATLPGLYKAGLKRIPRSSLDPTVVRFGEQLRKELTSFPGGTTDLVMADWIGELHREDIVRSAQWSGSKAPMIEWIDSRGRSRRPAPYLIRQQRQMGSQECWRCGQRNEMARGDLGREQAVCLRCKTSRQGRV